ncbi:MAG: FprA family A-type flavoprotein [Promethearchaeota archaeon]
MCAVEIVPEIFWVGVNYFTSDLFEGIWPIPHGVSINSYVVKGKKIAIIDLIKAGGGGSSENLIDQLGSIGVKISDLNFIILNHLEPDHTGYLRNIRELCPDAEILTSKKGVPLVKAFYDLEDNVRAVDDEEELDLGNGKKLVFYYAPNVHWPETMVTFEAASKTLFSCDAFGSFGALKGYYFDDQVPPDDKEFWYQETLRYYSNIVSTFSNNVLKAIEKLSALDIKVIAPSHGLIWRKDPAAIVEQYKVFANYMSEAAEPQVTVIWGTMYGNTEKVMRAVLEGLASEGVKVIIHKVPETDVSWVLASAWESAGLVLAMPTYEYNIFPPMDYVLNLMKLKHYWNKKVVRIGSYGWAGGAQKHFEEKIKGMHWDNLGVLEYQGAPTNDDLVKAKDLGMLLGKEVKAIPQKRVL